MVNSAWLPALVSPCEIWGQQSGLTQNFLCVLPFFHVSIIPPALHTRLHLHAALTRMTNGRNMGTF